MDQWITWIKELGFPIFTLIILWIGFVKLCKWLGPKLEGWIDRYVKSQEENAANLKELTQETLKIQKSNTDLCQRSLELQESSAKLLEAISNQSGAVKRKRSTRRRKEGTE